MKFYDGRLKYNKEAKTYGFVGEDGEWIKDKLEDGDRVDILLNKDERILTNFQDGYYKSLAPQAIDNWDVLTSLPAALLDLETPPKKVETPKEERRFRWFMALGMIAVSLLVSAILGAVFSWIADGSVIDWVQMMFWFIGAGVVTGSILMILNILPTDYCMGFGCALYYGTIFLAAFLSNFVYGAEENSYIIVFVSFVMVALVCYIVWLKKYKEKETK